MLAEPEKKGVLVWKYFLIKYFTFHTGCEKQWNLCIHNNVFPGKGALCFPHFSSFFPNHLLWAHKKASFSSIITAMFTMQMFYMLDKKPLHPFCILNKLCAYQILGRLFIFYTSVTWCDIVDCYMYLGVYVSFLKKIYKM